ncbi:hypothetical protein ES703_95200 [subsurface metagenome]
MVLLRAIIKPKNTAPVMPSPTILPSPNPAAAVSNIWAIPPRTAILPILNSSFRENSSPMAKSRRTTPISAREEMVAVSWTNPVPPNTAILPMPYGPTAIPPAR